jgi:uncharacterized membrane protein YadS
LDESRFGLWAALAIHDTSSVVGAGAKYGAVALTVATTVKLARALWIVPLALSSAALRARRPATAPGSGASVMTSLPWFILFFLGAAVMRTYVTSFAAIYPWLSQAGRIGMTVTLFLIGSGMSRASLRAVGPRPLLHGVVLWLLVAATSLTIIRFGWIGLA